jgi:MFS family permease
MSRGGGREICARAPYDGAAMAEPTRPETPGGPYARYVLGVLVVVYVLNFLDRQIISILAEHIKADLGVTDAQLGYLYGTAFAVFYAVFGIPLGRLADAWDRRKLIALGLAFWSVMTAVSGLARSFAQLALARIGVGVGEASASPAAYSSLADWFPPHRRATVLAIYSSGIYIGSGLGLGIGGLIVDRWDAAFGASSAPLGLRGWQVAFLAVGLPGLLIALWVRTLREPVRGMSDGRTSAPEPRPFQAFFRELAAIVPPFSLVHLYRSAPRAVLAANLGMAAALAALAAGLAYWVKNPVQWWSLAAGWYAAFTWGQSLRRRDPPAAALIFGTRSLRLAAAGFACLAFSAYALGFWIPPFLVRVHQLDLARAGLLAGGSAAAGGWLGVTVGGLLADRWRRRSPRGRLHVGLLNAVFPVPLALGMLWAPGLWTSFAFSVALFVAAALWLGPGASTVQDLVLPRMRSLASAAFLLVVTLLGLALGPYLVGRLSVALGDLRTAMTVALAGNVAAVVLFLLAARTLEEDEATRVERAVAAGEPDAALTPAARPA